MSLASIYRHSFTSPVRGEEIDANLDNINAYINAGGPFPYIILTPMASAPTPQQGMLYYNSTDGQLYFCKDGTNWSIVA